MRISDWSSDVCSSDLHLRTRRDEGQSKGMNGRSKKPENSLNQLDNTSPISIKWIFQKKFRLFFSHERRRQHSLQNGSLWVTAIVSCRWGGKFCAERSRCILEYRKASSCAFTFLDGIRVSLHRDWTIPSNWDGERELRRCSAKNCVHERTAMDCIVDATTATRF